LSYLGQTECKAADRRGLFVGNCIRQRGYPNRIAVGIGLLEPMFGLKQLSMVLTRVIFLNFNSTRRRESECLSCGEEDASLPLSIA
jgi:hypothetical protein